MQRPLKKLRQRPDCSQHSSRANCHQDGRDQRVKKCGFAVGKVFDSLYHYSQCLLKEGWDCPFAYIPCFAGEPHQSGGCGADRGAHPAPALYPKHSSPILNTCMFLTSSADFKRTLDGIVKGLNNAGFTDHDYRVQEEAAPVEPLPKVEQTIFPAQPTNEAMPAASAEEEEFFDFDPTLLGSTLAKASVSPSVQNIFLTALKRNRTILMLLCSSTRMTR